jgi:hypothetical protein
MRNETLARGSSRSTIVGFRLGAFAARNARRVLRDGDLALIETKRMRRGTNIHSVVLGSSLNPGFYLIDAVLIPLDVSRWHAGGLAIACHARARDR